MSLLFVVSPDRGNQAASAALQVANSTRMNVPDVQCTHSSWHQQDSPREPACRMMMPEALQHALHTLQVSQAKFISYIPYAQTSEHPAAGKKARRPQSRSI
jgi:hypothetical protein